MGADALRCRVPNNPKPSNSAAKLIIMTDLKLKHPDTLYTNARPDLPLSRLPLEIREIIYRYAVLPTSLPNSQTHHIDYSAADIVYGSHPRLPSFLPALCRVNEATRTEVGLWFIRNTEFGILYPQHTIYFTNFLATFPDNTGFSAIRRLDFPLFGRLGQIRNIAPSSAFVALMKRCPNLTEIRLKFLVYHLLKHRMNHVTRTPLAPAELEARTQLIDLDALIRTYELAALRELPSLTKITIEIWPRIVAQTTRGLRSVVADWRPVMEQLVNWLRSGLAEQGLRVDVKIEESGTPGLRWEGERRGHL